MISLVIIVRNLREDCIREISPVQTSKQPDFKTKDKKNNDAFKTEQRHIAFLKVHKAASTTVQNILYRFGLERNLSFVLPIKGNYISHHSDHYLPILPLYDKSSDRYDILCNHAMFNYTKFRQLTYDDAFYLAIVRDPLDLFISAAWYYRSSTGGYLSKINVETYIHDLISNPGEYEPKKVMASRTFNHMAKDFGFKTNSLQYVRNLNESTVSAFISNIMDSFDFVMVAEYFDESLIMLKRYLNWSTKDITYIKKNVYRGRQNLTHTSAGDVTNEDKVIFKKRNHLDYAVYEAFLTEFSKRRSEQKDLDDEVEEFKKILEKVKRFCLSTRPVSVFVFTKTKWHDAFRLDRQDCRLMLKPEMIFWQDLVAKHMSRLNGQLPDTKTQ